MDAVWRACEETLIALQQITNPQRRMEMSLAFIESLGAYAEKGAGIRHDGALEIRDAEKLTLAQLAERVGVSKARAGQMIDAARRREQGGGRDG